MNDLDSVDLDRVDLALARARTGLSPSSVQLERLEARIFELPAPGVASPGRVPPAQSPTAGRWAAFQATGRAGLLAAALLVTGGFIAGYFARPSTAQSVAPPAVSTSTTGVPSVPAPATLASAPASLEPAAAVPGAPPAEPTPSMGRGKREGRASAERQPAAQSSLGVNAELALLERIDRALRNSDAPLALALLDQLQHSHPRTHLDEERRAARLMAACLAGGDNAAVAASNFLGARPASVYASRLRAVCHLQ